MTAKLANFNHLELNLALKFLKHSVKRTTSSHLNHTGMLNAEPAALSAADYFVCRPLAVAKSSIQIQEMKSVAAERTKCASLR